MMQIQQLLKLWLQANPRQCFASLITDYISFENLMKQINLHFTMICDSIFGRTNKT